MENINEETLGNDFLKALEQCELNIQNKVDKTELTQDINLIQLEIKLKEMGFHPDEIDHYKNNVEILIVGILSK